MRLTPSPFVFVILVVSSLLAGCGGGGGGGTGPTGPPPGFAFATIRMMKVTPPGDPPLELASGQLTIPLASASDSMSLTDPGFDAALDQDLATNADAIIPALHQITDQLLADDAALPQANQKLSGDGTETHLRFSGGPFSIIIGIQTLEIHDHALVDPSYFDSQLRALIISQLRFFVKDQGGKLKQLKNTYLSFRFEN